MNTIIDLHIQKNEKTGYTLGVFERGKSLSLGSADFDCEISYMTRFEISDMTSRKNPDECMEKTKRFGQDLYRKIFPSELEKIWRDRKKISDFCSLCLRISHDAEELETLPWETLFDGEEFIAAGVKTSLIRLLLDIPIQENLPNLEFPVKMLAFLSSPLDLKDNERLSVEREQEILLHATNTPSSQGRLFVELEDEAKLLILENCFEEEYRIFHYSGHGISAEEGGGLLLENDQGEKRFATPSEILQSLQKGEKSLRLAVLSGCFTAQTQNAPGFQNLARSLARNGVPAVIAMQFSISDEAGFLFAETFYQRIFEGRPLDAALSAARRAILSSDKKFMNIDAFAPVLFLSHPEPLKAEWKAEKKTSFSKPIEFNYFVPLPQLVCGFYGRRREYRTLRDNLVHRNARAAVVHGIGGIGKTALITHAAKRLKGFFQGVFAFDCRSSALAPEIILLELHRFLEKLGNPHLGALVHEPLSPKEIATYMSQVLSDFPILLIFDNFETHLTSRNGRHEIEDQGLREFLNTLVQTTAEGTRFVFTSRHLFDIGEKRGGPVLTLALDDLSIPEALGMMQNLPRLAAGSLEEKINAIEKFGGHPYALVVVDRHCAKKSLREVLEEARNVHAELREFIAIEMSYGKLTENARELLNRVSAFRKPVETDALKWVMGGKSQDIDKPLWELIDWGLITPLEEDGEIKEYSVHCLVRDFCREKIGKESWKEILEDAAKFYTNNSGLFTGENKPKKIVFDDLEAFELLCEAEDFEDATAILMNNHPFLDHWGFGRWLESLYHRVVDKVRLETQYNVMGNMGILKQSRGEYEKALEIYEKVLKIAEELGDRSGVSKSLHQIGMIHQLRGEWDKALQFFQNSLKIKEELGDRSGVSISLHQIGIIHQVRGEWDKALQFFQNSLKIAEELGDRSGVSISLHNIGIIHQVRGEWDKALQFFQNALKIAEELGDRDQIARSLGQIGDIMMQTKRYEESLDRLVASFSILLELQSPDAEIVLDFLKELREKWGAKKFDPKWKKKTGISWEELDKK